MAKDKKNDKEIVNSKTEHVDENSTRKKRKAFHPFLYLLMLISLGTIAWSLYYIGIWYIENKKSNEVIEEIRSSISFEEKIIIDEKTKEEIKAIDFSKLLEKNPDTIRLD